jgi:capsular exopolysaccharide synthesis family protein
MTTLVIKNKTQAEKASDAMEELRDVDYPAMQPERSRILPDCLSDRAGAERIRALSQWLHHVRRKSSIRTLLVTSAAPKEGKTFVAVNLASVLARTSPPVLLIDADLRGPRIDKVMGFPSLPGLADCLERRRTLRSVIRRLDPPGLFYCPAGETTLSPGELLQGEGLGTLIGEASANFEWIVLDSPPVVPFVDSRCIASVADGTLLVARQHATSKDELRQAEACLGESRLLGLVLNACEDSRDKRYYSHYRYPQLETSRDSQQD